MAERRDGLAGLLIMLTRRRTGENFPSDIKMMEKDQ
jgi:hypothetical protein